jgi:hypothetical protein
MKPERMIGFVLLVGGVGLICWTAWSVYQVFSGLTTPPAVIDIDLKPISLPAGVTAPGAEPVEFDLLPAETVNRTTNMVVHLVLMGFLSAAGAKLANIGANLLRVVRVYLRESQVLAQMKPEDKPA